MCFVGLLEAVISNANNFDRYAVGSYRLGHTKMKKMGLQEIVRPVNQSQRVGRLADELKLL